MHCFVFVECYPKGLADKKLKIIMDYRTTSIFDKISCRHAPCFTIFVIQLSQTPESIFDCHANNPLSSQPSSHQNCPLTAARSPFTFRLVWFMYWRVRGWHSMMENCCHRGTHFTGGILFSLHIRRIFHLAVIQLRNTFLHMPLQYSFRAMRKIL